MNLPPSEPIRIVEVLDADISELMAIRHHRSFEAAWIELYASVMIAFFGGDTVRLEELAAVARACRDSHEGGKALHLCAELRLRIDRHELDPAFLREIEQGAAASPLWEGEILSLLAFAHDLAGDDRRCRDCNWKAYQALERIGARRKAVRILSNYLAAETRLRPDAHFIPDLLHMYRLAREVGEATAMALSQMHLSREYQKLGAWEIALRHANRAVAIAKRNAGNLTFYHTIVQRCHLLAQLGALGDARLDYQRARVATFSIIHASLDVLGRQFPELKRNGWEPARKLDRPGALVQFWRDREGERPRPALGKLEEKLLLHLSAGARTKRELTLYLYGDRIPDSSADARLFALLNRLKKRHPGLVQLSAGKYRLNHEAFLDLSHQKEETG